MVQGTQLGFCGKKIHPKKIKKKNVSMPTRFKEARKKIPLQNLLEDSLQDVKTREILFISVTLVFRVFLSYLMT